LSPLPSDLAVHQLDDGGHFFLFSQDAGLYALSDNGAIVVLLFFYRPTKEGSPFGAALFFYLVLALLPRRPSAPFGVVLSL